MICIHRKFIVHHFQFAWRGNRTLAMKVRTVDRAIVEKNMVSIEGVRACYGARVQDNSDDCSEKATAKCGKALFQFCSRFSVGQAVHINEFAALKAMFVELERNRFEMHF